MISLRLSLCAAACGIALLPLPCSAYTLPNGVVVEELTGDARWGCEVLLCLSNPNGPKAVSECVPPIDRLYRHLRKGHSFPKCPQAGPGNYAQPVMNPYDPCESVGLEDAPAGWIAEGKDRYHLTQARRYNGAGSYDSENGWGTKACVKKPAVGSYSTSYCTGSGVDRDCYRIHVTLFDKVVWMPFKSPSAIDVYIDGKLYHRVHY